MRRNKDFKQTLRAFEAELCGENKGCNDENSMSAEVEPEDTRTRNGNSVATMDSPSELARRQAWPLASADDDVDVAGC